MNARIYLSRLGPELARLHVENLKTAAKHAVRSWTQAENAFNEMWPEYADQAEKVQPSGTQPQQGQKEETHGDQTPERDNRIGS